MRTALADDRVGEGLRAGRLTGAEHPGGSLLSAPATVPAEPTRTTAVGAFVSLDAHRAARQRDVDRAAREAAAAREQAAAAERERAGQLWVAEQDEDRKRYAARWRRVSSPGDRPAPTGPSSNGRRPQPRWTASADLAAALTRQSTVESAQTAAWAAVKTAARASRAAQQRLTDASEHRNCCGSRRRAAPAGTPTVYRPRPPSGTGEH